MDEDIPSEAIEESLRFKHKDWAYENEWRLIQNEDAGFLNYEVSELVGIIIGENMSLDKRKVLVKLCKDKCIPCFRTYKDKTELFKVSSKPLLRVGKGKLSETFGTGTVGNKFLPMGC